MKFTSIYRGGVALALLLCSLECTHAGSSGHTVTVVAHVPGPGSNGQVYITGNRAANTVVRVRQDTTVVVEVPH